MDRLSLDGYVCLKQIAIVAMPDQVGYQQPHVIALDTSGRCWIRPHNSEWKLWGNPTVEKTPLSTPEKPL